MLMLPYYYAASYVVTRLPIHRYHRHTETYIPKTQLLSHLINRMGPLRVQTMGALHLHRWVGRLVVPEARLHQINLQVLYQSTEVPHQVILQHGQRGPGMSRLHAGFHLWISVNVSSHTYHLF